MSKKKKFSLFGNEKLLFLELITLVARELLISRHLAILEPNLTGRSKYEVNLSIVRFAFIA